MRDIILTARLFSGGKDNIMQKTEKPRFQVKRFLFETTGGEVVGRYMLTDSLIPLNAPNQFIEMKSVRKTGTGRQYAVKLAVFFNYLDRYHHIEYGAARNSHVQKFIDYLIYGDRSELKIHDPSEAPRASTLQGYITAITEFYRWLDHNYETDMEFHAGTGRRAAQQSFLYGQIYDYEYKYIVRRTRPDLNAHREYLKWYDEEQKTALCGSFTTLRDEAVFRLTLEGFRIDEVLSMRLPDYDSTTRMIRPSRSKARRSAGKGRNTLRRVIISEECRAVLDGYVQTERTLAENESGVISEWLFINLNAGTGCGKPLQYRNYLSILKRCAERAGLDPALIRTHSGRSTRVMELLERGVLEPERRMSEIELMLHFGWRSAESIKPYINSDSEIMIKSAADKHKGGGDGNG
jgi:site-specific recombinase XerD